MGASDPQAERGTRGTPGIRQAAAAPLRVAIAHIAEKIIITIISTGTRIICAGLDGNSSAGQKVVNGWTVAFVGSVHTSLQSVKAIQVGRNSVAHTSTTGIVSSYTNRNLSNLDSAGLKHTLSEFIRKFSVLTADIISDTVDELHSLILTGRAALMV